nr:MAG TPA: DNA-directed RNA polymerase [Caudoviricetes sp.]
MVMRIKEETFLLSKPLQQIRCPVCGKTLGKALPNSYAYGVVLWCKRCKKEQVVHIER